MTVLISCIDRLRVVAIRALNSQMEARTATEKTLTSASLARPPAPPITHPLIMSFRAAAR